MKLLIGDTAPDFKLPDQNNTLHKLSDYKGYWILLYFYPRDNTPGCTQEACQIRDNYSEFKQDDVKVLGVSTNSVASHDKFANKFNLPFTLLADTEKKVVKLYGVKKIFAARTSFLINPKGEIKKIYNKVNPKIHALEVIEDVKGFKNNK